jgi:hypothetical protein
MKMLEWKMIPTKWLDKHSMSQLKWGEEGSANSAALMIFLAISVYASAIDDPVAELSTGESNPTYEELQNFCGLSRALISKGLDKLILLGLIKKEKRGVKNFYIINDYYNGSSHSPWGKIPFKYFSKNGSIRNVFGNLNVRSKSTLHALKIYLMAIKYRSNQNNYASFSYDTIQEFTSIPKFEIKVALQVLSQNKFLIIDMIPAKNNVYRQNIYRIYGVSDTVHLATIDNDEFKRLTNVS